MSTIKIYDMSIILKAIWTECVHTTHISFTSDKPERLSNLYEPKII